jgi:hypothetical protein
MPGAACAEWPWNLTGHNSIENETDNSLFSHEELGTEALVLQKLLVFHTENLGLPFNEISFLAV